MAALLVRFVWLFAPFTYDPITIVNWMRAMTHGGYLFSVQHRSAPFASAKEPEK
jgi:hypothetical protein